MTDHVPGSQHGVKISTEELAKVEVDIWCSRGGCFTATTGADATRLAYDTDIEKLRAKARAALSKRKVKVEVKFFTTAGEEGVASGLHAGTGNVMVRIDGESMQITGYGTRSEYLSHDIPPEKLAEYLQLARYVKESQDRMHVIRKSYPIDIKSEVEAAIQLKISEQEEAS